MPGLDLKITVWTDKSYATVPLSWKAYKEAARVDSWGSDSDSESDSESDLLGLSEIFKEADKMDFDD